jgi:hypothetical protein
MITVNTQYFCEAANYFKKHGRYDDGIVDSYHYHDFWDQERSRVLNGYSVGGMRITGDHYWYLNYCPIMKVEKVDVKNLYGENNIFKDKIGGRVRGERILGFPDFWDEDYNVWNEVEQCEINGQHFLYLKPRGVGASYKGAAKAAKNFFCYPNSKSYMMAYTSEFLLGDGLFTKFLQYRTFLNKAHPDEERYLTAFGKPSDYKKDTNDMHYRATSNIDGKEEGYWSEVMGISLKDDVDKARGKRGRLALLEEYGAFPTAETVFNVLRSSFEEGNTVYGLIWAFGTGGSEAAKFGAMEKMFYSPESYNIRAYTNTWDEGMLGTKCGYFTPAYRNINFKDKLGNSDEITAKRHYDMEREIAQKSPDANAIIQVKSEHPYIPQEAILRNSHSPLPANEAIEWYHKVINLGYHKLGIAGELNNIDGTIKFRPNENLRPIDKFPHNIKDSLTGAIVQYYSPFKKDSRVPDNLYIIAHDPYAFDQSTDGESLGAAYVYMQPNNLTPPGDRIVATYFGRPKTTDDYNRNLFLLAQYYNAKIGFENDRGDVIGYAKRFKLLDWLSDEFELAFDADLPRSKVRRNFGMHIGSGKENLRMHKGNKYIHDWLITPRGMDEDGTQRLNLHTILCPATLKEISMYRSEGGNFDRISALRILAYYQKELVYKDVQPTTTTVASSSFFNRRHFI